MVPMQKSESGRSMSLDWFGVPPSGGSNGLRRLKPGLQTIRGCMAPMHAEIEKERSMNRPTATFQRGELQFVRVLSVPLGDTKVAELDDGFRVVVLQADVTRRQAIRLVIDRLLAVPVDLNPAAFCDDAHVVPFAGGSGHILRRCDDVIQ